MGNDVAPSISKSNYTASAKEYHYLDTGKFPNYESKYYQPKSNECDEKYSEKLLTTHKNNNKLRVDRRKDGTDISQALFPAKQFSESKKMEITAKRSFIKDKICLIRMKFGSSHYVGTAVNVKNDVSHSYFLTAAHNLRDSDQSKNASLVWVLINNKLVNAVKFHVHPKYLTNPGSRTGNDLGIIITKKQDYLLKYVHPMTVRIPSVAQNQFVTIYGYPGEKKGEIWGMSGSDVSIQETLIEYDTIDTTPGQSGSPILAGHNAHTGSHIVGIHTGGDATHFKRNWGTRFNKQNVKWMDEIIDLDFGVRFQGGDQ